MRIQCDWLTVNQSHPQLEHEVIGAWIERTDAITGDVEKYTVGKLKKHPLGGSVSVKASNGRISISGNPSHWASTNNVFGVSVDEGKEIFQAIAKSIGVPEFSKGASVSRLDLAINTAVGSPQEKRHVLLAQQAREFPRLKKSVTGTTTYYGRGSQRKQIRIYDKGEEYEAMHRKEIGYDRALAQWCESVGYIRYEWQLGKAIYERDPGSWITLNSESAEAFIQKDKELLLSESEEISFDERLEMLPKQSRLIYWAWRGQEDIKSMMSQAAYYKHRKVILEIMEVDIGNEQIIALPPRQAKTITFEPVSESDYLNSKDS